MPVCGAPKARREAGILIMMQGRSQHAERSGKNQTKMRKMSTSSKIGAVVGDGRRKAAAAARRQGARWWRAHGAGRARGRIGDNHYYGLSIMMNDYRQQGGFPQRPTTARVGAQFVADGCLPQARWAA